MVEVEVVTVDDIIEITKPCLIKIDVEGFETEVLNGMLETLKNDNLKAIIIELNGSGNRYGFDENLIHEKLIDYSFELVAYEPFSRKLTHRAKDFLDNKIYVRDINFVMERITNARSFNIHLEEF